MEVEFVWLMRTTGVELVGKVGTMKNEGFKKGFRHREGVLELWSSLACRDRISSSLEIFP